MGVLDLALPRSRPELVFQFGAPEPRSCSVGPASLQTRPEGLGSAPSAALLWVKHADGPVRKLARHRWRSAGTSFQSMLPLRKLFVSVRQTPSCMARSCQLVWMETGLAFIMTCHRLLAAYPQHAMELIRLHESVSSFAGMHLHCEKRGSRRSTF